ncbi:MAG: glycosyltransferase family 2 protein [Pirellulales bacterium]|nr:glycosyltransferase family 2 protein [Pirellulales bacterium]
MNQLQPRDDRPANEITLSVVLPVYNEVRVLKSLADQIAASLDELDVNYEMVFVNDGSSDGSTDVLDLMAEQDARIRVLHLSRNFGHQNAVHAGLSHATGDAVVLMDSDMQDSPQAIAQFFAKWREGYDVVYAVRAKRKESWIKRTLFSSFHRLMGAVAKVKIPVDAGNFSLFDRRVIREIVALGERDRYLPGLRGWVGHAQTGVVVERQARYDGKPRVSLRGLFRLAKTAIFGFSTFPLTVFYCIGVSALALFVSLAGFSLFCKLFTNLAIPGWTSHILSASFFGALNALGICILGEYVVRIYDQVRGRPIYLIDRTQNVTQCNERQGKPDTKTTGDVPYQELMNQTMSLLANVGNSESKSVGDEQKPKVKAR